MIRDILPTYPEISSTKSLAFSCYWIFSPGKLPTMKARIHIVVEGRVQGVGFRFECVRMATQLGLRGWVKNMDDGSVEIVAEGEREMVERMTAWARKGPYGAHISACRATPEPPTGEFESFEVRC